LYEIRYSTAPITPANFEAATKTKAGIFPADPGQAEEFALKELAPGTTYYVAIVAKSFYGNTSPLSNVVDASTLPAPVLQVNPDSYSLSLDRANGSTASGDFTLANAGAAPALYNAAVLPVAGNNILAYDKQQTSDNSIGLGGDSFISVAKFTAGVRGFNLTHVQNFLNSSITTGNVAIDIRILKGGTNPATATLLTSEAFTTVIPAAGRLSTFPLREPQQFAPGEVFWIAFVLPRGVDYPQGFDIVSPSPGTFYLSADNGGSYEDAQTLAPFLSGAAFKIRAANADWITLSPASGSIQPGQAGEVNMACHVNNLPDGSYQMHVLFKSNDGVNPEITRPVTLTVTGGQPKLAVEPGEVNFGTLFVGTSRTVKVTIANTGSATLTVRPEAINSGAFAPTDLTVNTQGSISLPPGKQQQVLATLTPSQRAALNGTLTLSSNDPAASTVTVPVMANVVSPPVAVITPDSLNFELDYGGVTTATEMAGIQNAGEAELTYSMQALVDPLASISYDANRQPDNYLGFGSRHPYIHTALKFDVNTPAFNLTHVQSFLRAEVAGNKNITLKVYKGGNLPTAGTLLLQQAIDAPASAANGTLVTIPLQQPQLFKQGDAFWVVLYYSGINQPQGYNANTPNAGRNFYSSNGTNWYSIESAGGVLASSTFIIKALDMPQWLSVSPGTGQVAAGNLLQDAITVNAAGLQKGRYKGTVQVRTNDPSRPLTTVKVNLQLEESPQPGFDASATEVLPGEAVTFLNSSKNADAYEWQFEGAAPVSSTLASPTVAYSKPGKYKVSLKAKSAQTGRTSKALVKEGFIVVESTLCQNLNHPFAGSAPLATNDDGYPTGNNRGGDIAKVNYFDYNRPASYVTGIKVKFGAAVAIGTSATIKIAVWDVDDSDGKPQSIIASKEVKLTEVAADVAAGLVTNVVFDAPVRLTGSFFAGVLLNNEPGNTVALVHGSNNGTTPGIAWTQDSQNGWNPFGAAWPEQADIAFYVQPAITRTIAPILADFTISADSVCVGEQVQLDASSTVGAVRYEWLLEGASITSTTAINAWATYPTAGTYRATLKAYDACSGVVVISKYITVKELPDATITANGATTFCAGESVTLTASEASGYLWSNGATTRSIVVSENGDFTVRVMNSNGCGTTSEEVKTVVYPLPDKPSIGRSDVTLTSNAATGNQWFRNSAAIPGATGAVYEATEPGAYQVQVTNADGCVADMSEGLNVTEQDLVTDLKVYPNPGSGIFDITFTGLRPDKVNIRIFDTVGKVVYEEKKNMLGSRGLQVNVSTAAAGVYMLQLQHNGRNHHRRIVVQH
jgi:plastocyanin